MDEVEGVEVVEGAERGFVVGFGIVESASDQRSGNQGRLAHVAEEWYMRG